MFSSVISSGARQKFPGSRVGVMLYHTNTKKDDLFYTLRETWKNLSLKS
jgi:hypothetical protein